MSERNHGTNEQLVLRKGSGCADPAYTKQVSCYCFGDLSEAERQAVERHLLECDACWESASRLD